MEDDGDEEVPEDVSDVTDGLMSLGHGNGTMQVESPNGVRNEFDDSMGDLQQAINSLYLQAVAEVGLWEDIKDELMSSL